MRQETINFSVFELILNEHHPTIEQMQTALPDISQHEKNGFTYIIKTETINNYFWINIEYGASHPRPEYVIDKSQNGYVRNPRSHDQVEPTQQLFCIYMPLNGNIYISNSQRNSFIQEILNIRSNGEFIVKRVVVDPEEFIQNLKIVDKMAIVGKTDLLSHAGSIYQPIQDIFGFDSPDQFFISATFERRLTDKIANQFRFFNREHKAGALKKFICVGKDDRNIETVFNTDNFTQKLVIHTHRTNNGLYESIIIRDEIIKQLDKLSG